MIGGVRFCFICIFIGLLFLLLQWAILEKNFNDSSTLRPSWRWCIRNIGIYADLTISNEFRWLENPCGFRNMTLKELQQEVFFRSKDNHIVFIGDSVAYRNFGYAVNFFLPFAQIDGYSKIINVSNHIVISTTIKESELKSSNITDYSRIEKNLNFNSSEITGFRNSYVHYVKLRYISLSVSPILEAINNSLGGCIIIYIGTWDLNWQINNRERVPNLGGPIRHFPTAIRYWTKFVQKLMEAIKYGIESKPLLDRPIIIFLEQFQLNCFSNRFLGSANRYKKCHEFISPIVIPFYRRVLAAMAWHLNIPVIPTTHFFKDNFKYCKISDGVHLDPPCMMTVQQHIWSVYLLLKKEKVVQGLLPNLQKLPDAMNFVDNSSFTKWLRQTEIIESEHLEKSDWFQMRFGSVFLSFMVWMMILSFAVLITMFKCKRNPFLFQKYFDKK